ncbi:DUF934 domain-containing protein [Acetobacter sp. DmW_136]|uniref:DUF934 domain-containing protein n=1 Tax=Acetobacter sp. DmW_136 TaxID=2591091 RepID=UPI00123A60DC|nr:DUF934 domain-containing protein [Acetobacter sp. DmW_136]KAA8384086.1 DUF934 domain-containing protein [Acetobacter sp. DmW_136]
MPLVDQNGRPVRETWQATDIPPATGHNLLLPFQVARDMSPTELTRIAPIGLRVDGNTAFDQIVPILAYVGMVVISFPSFRDGRGFTLATTLRRHGFSGELRASGSILPDQLAALRQCGFSSIETPPAHPPAQWQAAASSFSEARPLLKHLLAQQSSVK